MGPFISRKRSRDEPTTNRTLSNTGNEEREEDSTELKLAILASIYPQHGQEVLLEALLSCDGAVEEATEFLASDRAAAASPPTKRFASGYKATGYQSSLSNFRKDGNISPRKSLTRKGKTLHLYNPAHIASHTPCSIIHNFLPSDLAEALLTELLQEAPTFSRDTFKLFDRVVTSPHTFCFYVDNWDEAERQKTEYIYNGGLVDDVRRTLPNMRKVGEIVQDAVNEEIKKRIQSHYPGQEKLQYQSPHEWVPNASFVNVYSGGKESVGYHSDQLTYLGPRAVIGSLSLGVAREFRIRRVVPRNTNFDSKDDVARRANDDRADTEGQIAIHLPHNSLLVMHADMQEEWKHSIAPAQAIDPHPVAGNKRINITYRCYKASLHPKYTPKCRCNIPCVLKCVQKQQENRGKYMWMCHGGYQVDREGCSFFQWAEFDEDGNPPWWPKEEQRPINRQDETLDPAKMHENSIVLPQPDADKAQPS